MQKGKPPTQFKVNVEPQLKTRIEELFRLNNMTNKQGVTRLFEFALGMPDDLHPLMFGLIRGAMKDKLINAVMREIKKR